MKITIIGAGRVGTTLGARLAAAGHDVTYGVRDPAAWTGEGRVGALSSATDGADVVLLCVPWSAAEAVLDAAGPFDGQVLIDVTNPIGPGLTLTHGHTDSGAVQVQRWAPGARVAKALHSTGVENMASPEIAGQRLLMPVCADDEQARQVALTLVSDVGFEPVDAGPLTQARLLEPLAMLWIRLALVQGQGRGFGLAALRRG